MITSIEFALLTGGYENVSSYKVYDELYGCFDLCSALNIHMLTCKHMVLRRNLFIYEYYNSSNICFVSIDFPTEGSCMDILSTL